MNQTPVYPCVKCGTTGGTTKVRSNRPNRTLGLCNACYKEHCRERERRARENRAAVVADRRAKQAEWKAKRAADRVRALPPVPVPPVVDMEAIRLVKEATDRAKVWRALTIRFKVYDRIDKSLGVICEGCGQKPSYRFTHALAAREAVRVYAAAWKRLNEKPKRRVGA